MEKEKEVFQQIEKELNEQFLKVIGCEVKELGQVHRSFVEILNNYCFYRTLLEKYSSKDTAE